VQKIEPYLPEGDWPGAIIARARLMAGLTIRELARRTGVHELTISAWERNVNKPQPVLFMRVASYLGVSSDTLTEPSFLKMARARLGLTQRGLGELLGVSRFRVQEWELGRRRIPDEVMARIRSLLAEAESRPDQEAQPRLYSDGIPGFNKNDFYRRLV
jgi:transcriptional regulator with XRE-family HTH domain